MHRLNAITVMAKVKQCTLRALHVMAINIYVATPAQVMGVQSMERIVTLVADLEKALVTLAAPDTIAATNVEERVKMTVIAAIRQATFQKLQVFN